jgi:hypothetical protein
MGDSAKSRKVSIPDDVREMSHYAEQQRLGHGKIEFDELGNASWVPHSGGAAGNDVMRRLLVHPNLAISDEDPPGTVRRAQPNPQGLNKGYDPYDSGLLGRKQSKKKKDLKRLSSWIKSRKPKGD